MNRATEYAFVTIDPFHIWQLDLKHNTQEILKMLHGLAVKEDMILQYSTLLENVEVR